MPLQFYTRRPPQAHEGGANPAPPSHVPRVYVSPRAAYLSSPPGFLRVGAFRSEAFFNPIACTSFESLPNCAVT